MKITITHKACAAVALAYLSSPFVLAASSFEQLPKPEAQGQSIISAQTSVEGDHLVVTFGTEDSPTVWNHIYLDTDGSKTSGHRHYSDTADKRGHDYLVEGDALYRWSGQDDQAGWHWEKLTGVPITKNTNGNEVTVEIPLEALTAKPGADVSVLVETMTDNFQGTLDVLPRTDEAFGIKLSETAITGGMERVALVQPSKDARVRFKDIKDYACYYGKGQTQTLAGRDAVIIETKSQSPRSVADIKKDGTVVIGYISAGEDDKLRKGDGMGPGGYDSCYYDRNGDNQPDRNEIWSSYFTKAASESWINHFLSEARRLKAEYGVDGFFLDTVETFTLYTDNRQPMIDLIKKLREENPDSVIVLNRGWDILKDLAGTVDGMMFESFTLSYDFASKSYVRMRPSALDEGREIMENLIKPVQESHGLVVLALDYAANPNEPGIKDSFDRAVSLGMVPEVTTIYLDAIFPHNYTGVKSDKWLKNFLTPESVTHTTKGEINGFPSGTRIVPSSIYADYEVNPVVDGLADKKALGWRDRAWASSERPIPHSLTFEFPKARPVSELKVVWATDNGETFPSKKVSIQVEDKSSKEGWKTVWKSEDNTAKTIVASFPEVAVQKVRILQESEGGSSARPNLMWVEQVALNK